LASNFYRDQFNDLVEYLTEEFNIEVVQKPNETDAWYPHLNMIRINNNLKYRERFFTLIHETGHAILDNAVRHKNITCFNKNIPENIKSKKNYVHTLNEEILAWNYGKMFLKKMSYKYEEDRLEEYMTDCIMSYIRHGLKSIYGNEINADIIWTKYV